MDLHKLVVVISGIVLVVATIVYALRPSEMIGTVILTILAFLFGKASNGWKKTGEGKE